MCEVVIVVIVLLVFVAEVERVYNKYRKVAHFGAFTLPFLRLVPPSLVQPAV